MKQKLSTILVVFVLIGCLIGGFFIVRQIGRIIIDRKQAKVSITDPIKNDPNQKPPDNSTNPNPDTPTTPVATGKVVYKIGSNNITDLDLEIEILKLKPPDFEARMQAIPENDQKVFRSQLTESALKNLVNQIYFKLYLIDQKINITQADEEKTKKDLIEMMQKVHAQQNSDVPFDLEARLKQYNISMDTFNKDIKNQTIYRIVTTPFLEKITATEEEAKKFFKEHPDMYNEPAKADLKHILLDSEADADAVIRDLNQGANFETLAKTKSKDPQVQQNNGSLGWIANDRKLVPQEILQVIFDPSVKLNTPLKIQVTTQWYVMIVKGKQQEIINSYESLKDKAIYDAKEEKRVKALDEFIKKLEEKYGKPIPQR